MMSRHYACRIRSATFVLTTTDDRLQCAICTYLLSGPLQFPSGHRICTPCARKLKQVNAVTFTCKKCKEMISFSDYFYDKAVAKQIDNTIVSCPHCGWNGEYRYLQNHECQMVTAAVSCPNEGCKEVFMGSQLDDHIQNCQYSRSIKNRLFNKQDVFGSSSFAAQGKLKIQKCTFAFLGCQFEGNDADLAKHMQKDMNSHLEYVCKFLLSNKSHVPSINRSLFEKAKQISKDQQKTNLPLTEIQGKKEIEDLLAAIQASITEINHIYEDISLTLQTLQATSYNGKYIWKIPDITRRRRDAQMGKTISLYSAPFYTDRFGYRMCLRVYLDGDGSGKGHYISYFLTIIRGEYDALLEWPFQLTVTMTMINQKGDNNIVQSFKPNPNSASFHRPKAEMNVASGCPKFAALSVLDNPEFIVDDVAFFQCVVNNK